ncbi:hypothetical protein RQP46_011101 [Phenoliferia psychrophenolica]
MFSSTFQPRSAFSPLHFHSQPPTDISPSQNLELDFDAYDAHRTALEQRALAQKQRERREAEQLALHRHQHRIELERRQQQEEALYEALARRQAHAVALEQERRRQQARLVAAREAARQQEYESYIEEVQRRKAAIANAAAQEQRRRLAAQHAAAHQQQRQQEQVQEEEFVHPLQSFLQHLFESSLQPSSATTAAESVPQPSDATPAPLPVPVFLGTPSAPTIEVTSPEITVEVSVDSNPVIEDPSTSEAATTLQRHFRAHAARRTALSSLATLSSSLASQKSSFIPPTSLAFQPSSSTTTSTPTLAYSSTNATFLAYEDFLVGLLTKVDGISSGGDKFVKSARKELVRAVEAELRSLDERKDVEWEKLSAGSKASNENEERSDG